LVRGYNLSLQGPLVAGSMTGLRKFLGLVP
jgi:hypothetical protein